ncbi:MAG: Sun protein [Myxococcales bacterium]|nr:Sun protein [Myxococcales bacterium]
MATDRTTSEGPLKAAATARELATRVLQRVADEGAFASVALDAELGRAGLEPRDAALATAIVYGALRVLPELDAQIEARLRRKGRLDPLVQAVLRAACYQLQHLGRLPTHAIVDQSVTLVRAARGKQVAGFVNAVLRALSRQRPKAPSPPTRLVPPAWIAAALTRDLGAERAERLLRIDAEEPPLGLRARPGEREALAQAIAAVRPRAQVLAGSLAPDALLVHRAGDPRALPGYVEGAFVVQEQGAQALAHALGAQPGERVADLCAGHGGKTTLLAQMLFGASRVPPDGPALLSVDVDPRKLERIGPELVRLGLPAGCVQTRAVDLSVGLGGIELGFDRVLVDAPCSGLGTLGRRPDLALRLSPADPARLGELQRAILERALQLVRPGGLLLFAVCSPLNAEGAAVATALERAHPGLERLGAEGLSPALQAAVDADSVLRLGPWLSDEPGAASDAYQVLRWRLPAG